MAKREEDMGFKFEELRVWQKALDLAADISVLAKSFPSDEKYILASQISRAADSVALNIAEGSTGQSDKEFNRFLGIGLRSAIEVVACLHVGKKRGITSESHFGEFYSSYTDLIKMIQALRKTLN